MKRNRMMLGLILMVCAGGTTAQACWNELYLPGAVMTADYIVEGKVIQRRGEFVISVNKSLWGPPVKLLAVGKVPSFLERMSTDFLKVGDQGYFIVHNNTRGGYRVSQPSAVISKEQGNELLRLLEIRKNPKRYLAAKPSEINDGFAYLLGDLFRSARSSCKEYPGLGKSLLVTFRDREHHPGKLWPWDVDEVGTVHMKPDPENDDTLHVTAVGQPNALTQKLTEKIQLSWVIENKREIFRLYKDLDKTGLTFTIDNRKVQEAKGISRKAAVAYLHACLKSKDELVVLQALQALSLMQDTESIPVALSLLEDDRGKVVSHAAEFLSRSRKSTDDIADRLIAAYKRDKSKKENRSGGIMRYMVRIDHPRIAAFVEQAAVEGDPGAVWICALPWVASDGTIGKIIGAMKNTPGLYGERAGRLTSIFCQIIRRSNKPLEPWMKASSLSSEEKLQLRPRWIAWWEENKEGFRLIRSNEEAERIRWIESAKEYNKRQKQKKKRRRIIAAGIGLGIILCFYGVWKVRKSRSCKKQEIV
jgi:hypothetical protein